MAYGAWYGHVRDEFRRPMSGVVVTVTDADTDDLVALYADRDGNKSIGNPFLTTAEGRIAFYCAPGRVNIEAAKNGQSHVWPDEIIVDDWGGDPGPGPEPGDNLLIMSLTSYEGGGPGTELLEDYARKWLGTNEYVDIVNVPNSDKIACLELNTFNSVVTFLDRETGDLSQPLGIITGQGTRRCIACSADYTAAGHDSSPYLSIFDNTTGARVYSKTAHDWFERNLDGLSFSPDGAYLAATGANRLVIYDTSDFSSMTVEDAGQTPWCVKFSSDGGKLFVGFMGLPGSCVYQRIPEGSPQWQIVASSITPDFAGDVHALDVNAHSGEVVLLYYQSGMRMSVLDQATLVHKFTGLMEAFSGSSPSLIRTTVSIAPNGVTALVNSVSISGPRRNYSITSAPPGGIFVEQSMPFSEQSTRYRTLRYLE